MNSLHSYNGKGGGVTSGYFFFLNWQVKSIVYCFKSDTVVYRSHLPSKVIG